MNYQINTSTINFLTQWEFKSNKMYFDSSHYPTIGIGHLIKNKNETFMNKKLMIDILTDHEVDLLLQQDLIINLKVIDTISHKIKGNLNQNQVDALVLFIFNEGTIWNGLMNVINSYSNDYTLGETEIRTQWISYNKSRKKVVAGLINRRQGEVDLFFSKYMGRDYYNKAFTNSNGKIINNY